MSTESRKESVVYFRSKEATAGTEDTFDFFQSNSVIITKPPSVAMKESNLGKLGSGEFGTKEEIQAIYSTFSMKASRLSEVLYLLSFALGKEDSLSIRDVPNTITSHLLTHLAITSRTLPTFTFMYKDGIRTHLCTHSVITDFTLTLANGGNGLVDFTANGVCNMHSDNSGTLTKQNAATVWSSGAYTSIIASEPLINYKGCNFYMGTATEAVPLVHGSVSYSASDLANSETLTPFINSVTITGNNGFSAEDALRAGGGGIINNQERKEYSYTLELNLRKDDTLPASSFDARSLADTQCAIEIQWQGKIIKDALRYAMNIFFPVVQIGQIAEDDESPINQTIPCTVFADSQGTAIQIYGQNKIGIRLNASHGASGEASSSQSASNSSSSAGLSSSSSS